MNADLLREAADRLEDPALCNTNPWDKPLAAWLRSYEGVSDKHPAAAVVRAILGGES